MSLQLNNFSYLCIIGPLKTLQCIFSFTHKGFCLSCTFLQCFHSLLRVQVGQQTGSDCSSAFKKIHLKVKCVTCIAEPRVRLAAIQCIHNISSTFAGGGGATAHTAIAEAQVQQPSLLSLDGDCTFQASCAVPDLLLFVPLP